MNAAELAVQVANTAAFIDSRPVDLILTPHRKVSDGSGGGRLTAQPARPPQHLRFVESSSVRADIRNTETGEQWAQDAVLLGMPDAVIEVNDTFDWDGSTWRVTEKAFPNGYEVRATVVRYGR